MITIRVLLRKHRFMTVALVGLVFVLIGLLTYQALDPGRRKPVCVMYDEAAGGEDIVGLEQADIVYEWQLPGGASQRLAVFYGSWWKAGPLGTLNLGAAHLAAMYGTVVCRDVTQQAEEFLTRYEESPPIIYRLDEGYIKARKSLAWFASKGAFASDSDEYVYSPSRGDYPEGDLEAPVVKGVSSDGNEAFDWRWDGRLYRRTVEGTSVWASAVVILSTYPSPRPDENLLNNGGFPNGLLAGDAERAVVCVNGRAFDATWWHRASFTAGLALENWAAINDDDHLVRLPKGKIWYEIVKEGDTLSITG